MNQSRVQINWSVVKDRVAQSRQAMEDAFLNRSGTEEIMWQRAVQLAQRQSSRRDEAGFRALVFWVAGERYALNLLDLSEVTGFTGITPVPSGPKQLLGVVNARGEIRAVLNLRRILGLDDSTKETAANGFLLMVQRDSLIVGLKADHVEGLRFISLETLTLPADEQLEDAQRFVRGITPDHVIFLNTDAVLSHAVFRDGD